MEGISKAVRNIFDPMQKAVVARYRPIQKSITDSVPESQGKDLYGYFGSKYGCPNYVKYGLYRDDCRPRTKEFYAAMARLDPKIKAERELRLERAFRLSLMKCPLPFEEWTTVTEDTTRGQYLTPIFEEIYLELKQAASVDEENLEIPTERGSLKKLKDQEMADYLPLVRRPLEIEASQQAQLSS